MSGAAAEALWRDAVRKVLKGADLASLTARSDDGLPIAPLYPMAATADPIRRATAQPIQVIARADNPDPDAANRQALDDLRNGAGGLAVVVETAAGHPFGLRAASLATSLSGVEIEAVALRCDAPFLGDDAARTALVRLADRRGLVAGGLDIDFGIDPVSDMARRGGLPTTWEDTARKAADAAKALRDRGFRSALLRADGRPHHEAGASEAQELAAVLASGLAALRALEEGGFTLDEARDALSFTLALDADLLLGLSKCRALRQLWATMERACGLSPKPIRLHVETAWRMMARQDPWTNMLRVTLAVTAAILGGADSVTALPFTSALGLPDGLARRIARNTPLILLEEAHLGRVVDPAAGAGAVEALTEALGAEAWRLLQETERRGGLPAALIDGSWQALIAASRKARQAALAAGVRTIVGVTAFTDPGAPDPEVLLPMPDRVAPPNTWDGLRFPALPSRRDDEGPTS